MRSFVHQNPNQAFFCRLAAATGTQKQKQQDNDIIFCLWVLVSLGFCRLMNPSPPPPLTLCSGRKFEFKTVKVYAEYDQVCSCVEGMCMCACHRSTQMLGLWETSLESDL